MVENDYAHHKSLQLVIPEVWRAVEYLHICAPSRGGLGPGHRSVESRVLRSRANYRADWKENQMQLKKEEVAHKHTMQLQKIYFSKYVYHLLYRVNIGG
jgi:hypothetical protein